MNKTSYQEKLLWLMKTAKGMISERQMDKLYTLIGQNFLSLTLAKNCFIFAHNPESHALTLKVNLNEEDLAEEAENSEEINILNLCNKVIQEKKPLWRCYNLQSKTKTKGEKIASEPPIAKTRLFSLLHKNHTPKDMVALPLTNSNQEITGIIYSALPPDSGAIFDANYKEICELFSEYAALALENAELFGRAANDPLTGLPNSSYFLQQLDKILRDKSNQKLGGILLLDLDAFKRINLVAGAGVGDKALIDVANTLKDILSADGLVSRYGSDKFAVLLPRENSTIAATDLRLRDAAERARAAIATKIYNDIKLSVSIGGIIFPQQNLQTAAELIALADDVLAEARKGGPGQIKIAN